MNTKSNPKGLGLCKDCDSWSYCAVYGKDCVRRVLEEAASDLKAAEASLIEYEMGGGTSLKELKRDLNLQ